MFSRAGTISCQAHRAAIFARRQESAGPLAQTGSRLSRRLLLPARRRSPRGYFTSPVAMAKSVSSAKVVCTSLIVRPSPSCAIWATLGHLRMGPSRTRSDTPGGGMSADGRLQRILSRHIERPQESPYRRNTRQLRSKCMAQSKPAHP